MITLRRPAPASARQLDPVVSVVVPTFRRDDMLLRLLERLAKQRLPADDFEIIVVDDARSDTTPAAVAAFAGEHPGLHVRALPGASHGPATARNIGWRAARGDVIAFIDDDAYPSDRAWLAEGLRALSFPGVDAAVGRVVVPADDPPTDFQRNVRRLETAAFVTCNAFVRRSALERVGGFDERFTAPYREDSDLEFRIRDTSGRIVRTSDAVVVHPAPRGTFAVSLKLQRYSMHNALLYRKHRARFRREIEPAPPLHYYAIVASTCVAVLAAVTGRRRVAFASAVVAAALDGRFFIRRVRGSSCDPRHLADMALTSLLIPWLSIYWRLRGALRYRVLFF